MFRLWLLEYDHAAIWASSRDGRAVGSGNNQGGIIRIFDHHVDGGNRVEVRRIYNI